MKRPLQRQYQRVDDSIGFYTDRKSPPIAQTLLRQYEFLRAEVTASLANQVEILSFGSAAIGLTMSAALVNATGAFGEEVLIVLVPLLAYLTLTLWFAEAMRIFRAGGFLLTLEKKLDELEDGSLNWESWVWRGRTVGLMRRRISDPDYLRLLSITFLLLAIAGTAMALGWAAASWAERVFALGAGSVVVVVVASLYYLRIAQLADLLEEANHVPTMNAEADRSGGFS